jgi:hypothetical protein
MLEMFKSKPKPPAAKADATTADDDSGPVAK